MIYVPVEAFNFARPCLAKTPSTIVPSFVWIRLFVFISSSCLTHGSPFDTWSVRQWCVHFSVHRISPHGMGPSATDDDDDGGDSILDCFPSTWRGCAWFGNEVGWHIGVCAAVAAPHPFLQENQVDRRVISWEIITSWCGSVSQKNKGSVCGSHCHIGDCCWVRCCGRVARADGEVTMWQLVYNMSIRWWEFSELASILGPPDDQQLESSFMQGYVKLDFHCYEVMLLPRRKDNFALS